ncbi:MAG: HNH endonuclease [Anaerolineae bacterium]|nr:HNH endonuclease [Anaerolineae bacterium]
MSRQRGDYKYRWERLIEIYGTTCFWCGEEVATTIDHIIPVSWNEDNSIENLVPSCALCNLLASDKVFEYIAEKRAYILHRRKQYTNRRAICTECLLPYAYRVNSPSLFLCAECYDREYGTGYAKKRAWHQWLRELRAAGIVPEAHRAAREKCGPYLKRYGKIYLNVIADGYEDYWERQIEWAIR